MRRFACVVLCAASPLLAQQHDRPIGAVATLLGTLPGPLPLFPANNWWNVDISAVPVDPKSGGFITFVGPTRGLHADMGGQVGPNESYGIPYIVVDGSQAKKTVLFDYSDESDGVDHNTDTSFPFYPIPDEAITQPFWIEGGAPGNQDPGGDRHMLIVDKDNKLLYELFALRYVGGQWEAGSGARFNLNTNDRRPETWTSADAAGLAILPGLLRYDEVYGPDEIKHAFRMTTQGSNGYVFPASHAAGTNSAAPPMGARFRLKASKDISSFSPAAQKIFRAMKKYGMIVADNGSNLFVTGTYDPRWDDVIDGINSAFGAIKGSDLEVVQLGYQPTSMPAISIADVSVNEGHAGVSDAVFQVTLSEASVQPVTVSYASANSTAFSHNDGDYLGVSGTLTFAPGVTSLTIAVPILGDRFFEEQEILHVNLSSPTNATIARAQAAGTILNDDAQGLSIADLTLREPLAGDALAAFHVTLAPPATQTVVVNYTTSDGTAIAGQDYIATAGTLTFQPGEVARQIGVMVKGDLLPEGTETFSVNLSGASGAPIGSAQGTLTIADSRGGADFDADGRSDIMWRKVGAGVDKGAMFLWTMNGTGLVGARYLDPIAEDWQVQFMGDFNGDGLGDVLWRNFGTGADAGKLFIWMMQGPYVVLGTGYTASQADLGWRVDGVGDLNGNGKSDIIWRKTGAGVDKGAVFLWTMNGTGLAGARYLDPISEDWQVVDLGDFNGDGKADVLWRNMNTTSPDAGKLYVWMMDGPNVIGGTGYTASQADLGWRVDGVGDLNGDGKDDIVWRKTGAGVDKGAVFLWTMNGTGLAGARYLDPIGEDWQVQGVGDFNGDGKTDILWRNQGPGVDVGKLYVWIMDGPNVVAGTGYTAAQADLGWRVDSPKR